MTCSKCGNEVDGSLENKPQSKVDCERCGLLASTISMWGSLKDLCGNRDGARFFQARYGDLSYGNSSENNPT